MMTTPLRVLLLEDNPGDARLLREYFADAPTLPVTLTQADRLADALRYLREQSFDIILSDLDVPDSRGLETFIQIHAQAPDTPVVVLSGLTDEAVAVQAVASGAQDYLVKSDVNANVLIRALRYAIERHRAERQLARYAAELREKNAQLHADLALARQLQLAILPHDFPRIPPAASAEDSALRFFSFYYPTGGVSGDFFEVFSLSDTAVGVFICDVMGHGVRAALVTAMMRALVQGLPAATLRHPERLLAQINRGLLGILRQTELTLFATAFYLVADVANSRITFASAGHPTPLLRRRSDRTATPLLNGTKPGPALGLFEDAAYTAAAQPLMPEDLLLLFTDGLYEVQDSSGAEYSSERLLAAVRQHADLPARTLFDQILTDVQQFAAHHDFTDDVCLIGMEVHELPKSQ